MIVAFVVVAGCGASSSVSETETAPPSQNGAATDTATPPAGASLALHEWGLVDVDLATGQAEISAGPGQPARPVIARKPVIYAHLVEGERASLDLRVRIPGGAILEHWPLAQGPAGELGADTIGWHVEVTRGACPADPARWATRDTPACGSADGYCETPELPRYVTADHDCLRAGATSAPLLFYRARVPLAAIPLHVERTADLRVRALSPGARTVLRISTALSGPWPVGHVVIARAELAPGATTDIAIGEIPVGQVALDPTAERAAMERALLELGLTGDEARVFLDTWTPTLFGATAATRESTRRGAQVGPPQDVLLTWLTADEVAAIAPLEASIPVEARRAWLVRIDLGAVTTAGPAAP